MIAVILEAPKGNQSRLSSVPPFAFWCSFLFCAAGPQSFQNTHR